MPGGFEVVSPRCDSFEDASFFAAVVGAGS